MAEKDRIKVLVVDDHPVVREGICLLLGKYAGIEVVGSAVNGAEALSQADLLDPDVVLMDLSMPVIGGIQAIRELKEKHPDAKIIALTVHDGREYLARALSAGASGYVLKGASSEDLARSVRSVYADGMYVDPNLTREFVAGILHESKVTGNSGLHSAGGPLSIREMEILSQAAGGLSNQEIGSRLNLNGNTVQTYRTRIMQKLGLHSRSEMIRYAIQSGLLAKE
ncbi:MAG: response regulator transcription factor [Dehalococcoidia bacterium]|nr:response regulator transcription factor [Dehalococcoidia bacterium]